MPVVVFASAKGGAGKTTAAILVASEIARSNGSNMGVALVDADPNQHSAKWAKKEGCPPKISLIENSNADTIIDDIDKARRGYTFVIVDLEGRGNITGACAISRADLVIIPCQGSLNDADEAMKTIKFIKNQSKLLNRNIAYSVLMTRTSPAITSKNLKHIINEFKKAQIDIFENDLTDREAFRTIHFVGGTINDLDSKQVGGVEKAIENSKNLTREILLKLRDMQAERATNHG